mmetsp:Transcript_2852/g.8965  ORF Transcript_2852/g.8965 Transcript_2852/m.8965 type:complete len:328 (-) Transcript_2852:527-1510(-)
MAFGRGGAPSAAPAGARGFRSGSRRPPARPSARPAGGRRRGGERGAREVPLRRRFPGRPARAGDPLELCCCELPRHTRGKRRGGVVGRSGGRGQLLPPPPSGSRELPARGIAQEGGGCAGGLGQALSLGGCAGAPGASPSLGSEEPRGGRGAPLPSRRRRWALASQAWAASTSSACCRHNSSISLTASAHARPHSCGRMLLMQRSWPLNFSSAPDAAKRTPRGVLLTLGGVARAEASSMSARSDHWAPRPPHLICSRAASTASGSTASIHWRARHGRLPRGSSPPSTAAAIPASAAAGAATAPPLGAGAPPPPPPPLATATAASAGG